MRTAVDFVNPSGHDAALSSYGSYCGEWPRQSDSAAVAAALNPHQRTCIKQSMFVVRCDCDAVSFGVTPTCVAALTMNRHASAHL